MARPDPVRATGQCRQANVEVGDWLDTVANVRIHARTHRRPVELFAEEQARLKPLPPHPYDCGINNNVKANRQCMVSFAGNRYSVPAACTAQPLILRRYADKVLIYHQGKLVAEHVRSYDRGQPVTAPDHGAPTLAKRRRARRQVLLRAFLQLRPAAEPYYRELELRDMYPLSHIRRILALATVHGTENTVRAVEDALAFQAFGADYIASILDQRRRLLPSAGPLHLARNQDLLEGNGSSLSTTTASSPARSSTGSCTTATPSSSKAPVAATSNATRNRNVRMNRPAPRPATVCFGETSRLPAGGAPLCPPPGIRSLAADLRA